MKQIKTIKYHLDYAEGFDKAVNEALCEGWSLTSRKVLLPPSQPNSGIYFNFMLYAELEKEIITDAERCCENCKHFDLPSDAEPCIKCSDNASHWEPCEP
jgi:hypothetical protein